MEVSNGESGGDLINVSVSGGTGTVTLTSDNYVFDIGGATVQLTKGSATPVGADGFAITGAVYGNNNDYLGGDWQADFNNGEDAAAGIYAMDKGGTGGKLTGYGFFTTMAVRDSSGGADALYASHEAQNFGGGADVRAILVGSAGELVAAGGFNYLKSAYVISSDTNLGSPGYDITVNEEGTETEGSTEILSWGTWQSATLTFSEGASGYHFPGKGYYVTGTPTSTMPTGSTQYTYSGTAKGMFADGNEVSGPVGCKVIFNSGTVSDFSLAATNGAAVGPGYRAVTITCASGNITGNEWSIDTLSGTKTITRDGTSKTISESRINGAFYGTNADHMAGVWAVKSNADSKWAASGYLKMDQH